MKFDLHLNVGKIYRSANKRSIEMHYTGKELAEYCNHYELTHAVVLYSSYEYMEELKHYAPNTKLYGVKWMIDFDNQELDIGKEMFYGVKLHSHRGYRSARLYDWEHPKKKNKDAAEDELSYGLDYSDDNAYLYKVLEKLPTGSLVYMHSQGSPDPKNRANPKHFLNLALKYTNLKFIMGHAGGYGAMAAAKPAKRDIPLEIQNGASLFKTSNAGYLAAVSLFKESVWYANKLHNLFLDSSCFTKEKAIALGECRDRWAIGSDYPFGANKGQGNINFTKDDFKKSVIWNYDTQYRSFVRILGEDRVNKTHQDAVRYIETPIEELAKEQLNYFD